MTPSNVQGPNGPHGVNYVQSAEVINNNNYVMPVPDSYYQDRVSFSSRQVSFTPQQAFAFAQEAYMVGVQDAMSGCYGNRGMTQTDQLNQTFAYADALVNSMYASSNDPLASVRGLGNMVSQAINGVNPQGYTANRQQLEQQLQQLLQYKQELQNQMDQVDQMIAQHCQALQGGGQLTDGSSVQQEPEINAEKVKMAAQGLHAAMDGWFHTDEEGINTILENLTPAERAEVELTYAQMYGNGDPEALRSDLRSELSFGEEDKTMALLDEAAAFNPLTGAAALHEAMDGLGTDDQTVKDIFENATPEQLKAIEEAYDTLYGEGKPGTLREDIAGDYGFWDSATGGVAGGAAAGAATAAGAAAIVNVVPGLGQIAYGTAIGIGAIVGGVFGLFSDPSGGERNEYLTKLQYASQS